MVSAIQQKKNERAKEASMTSPQSSSNIPGFLSSLVTWLVGIVISIIMYISFTTAYYTYNTEEHLPTDPKNYPYAQPSMKQNILQHAKHIKETSQSISQMLKSKGMDILYKLGLAKHVEKASSNIERLKNAATQKGGGKNNKVQYFYRKRNNFLSDWIADVLIYSWSTMRENISDLLPSENSGKTLENASYFSKLFMFLGAPLLVKLSAIFIVPFIGMIRTFYGVFSQSPTTSALIMSIVFVLFPFPILAPVFSTLAIVAGILQGAWFFYFFGIKGFMNSQPGTFKQTARNFTHVISIIIAIALINASVHLSSGAGQGVSIAAIIMIVFAFIDIARKMYTKSQS